MSKFDVVGIGQVCVDYLGRVERYPGVEERVELEQLVIRPGGPTATALLVLARFGMKVSFIGKIGDDDMGREVSSGLKKEGIDTSYLITEAGKKSQTSFIPIELHSGKRTVFWSRGGVTPLKPEDVKKEVISRARAIHFDELFVEAALEAARIAKKSGVVVSMDAGGYKDGIDELRGKVDLFIVSEDFMARYSGEKNPRKAIKKLNEFGAKVTAVTLGDKGSLTVYENEMIMTPTYKVDAVDTTGAGDVFRGAFLYGWLHSWNIRKILQFASAASAMNCLGLGAYGGVPENVNEVFNFMGKYAH